MTAHPKVSSAEPPPLNSSRHLEHDGGLGITKMAWLESCDRFIKLSKLKPKPVKFPGLPSVVNDGEMSDLDLGDGDWGWSISDLLDGSVSAEFRCFRFF